MVSPQSDPCYVLVPCPTGLTWTQNHRRRSSMTVPGAGHWLHLSAFALEMTHVQRPLGRPCTLHQRLVASLAAFEEFRERLPQGPPGWAKKNSLPDKHYSCGNLHQKTPSFIHSSFSEHCRSLAEKAMEPHSSTLAWKIPWTEEPGGLQSMGLLRVGHD